MTIYYIKIIEENKNFNLHHENIIWGIHISTYYSTELLQILMSLTAKIKPLLPNFVDRAIVILNFVRRFRNFIVDTVPW